MEEELKNRISAAEETADELMIYGDHERGYERVDEGHTLISNRKVYDAVVDTTGNRVPLSRDQQQEKKQPQLKVFGVHISLCRVVLRGISTSTVIAAVRLLY